MFFKSMRLPCWYKQIRLIVPVFGLLKRNGKVYACIIPNAKVDILISMIGEKVQPDSIVYSDSVKSYRV